MAFTLSLTALGGALMLSAHDVTVAVPRQWATHSEPNRGVLLAARSRHIPESGFAPELVLRSSPIDGPTEGWRDGALAAMAGQLDDFDVEDTDEYDLAGHPVTYHRFSHRLDGTDVVSDQWSWVADGVGITLTGSVARGDYTDYYDLFEDVAATVQFRPRAA